MIFPWLSGCDWLQYRWWKNSSRVPLSSSNKELAYEIAEGYQTFHYDMDNFQAAALFLFFIAVVDTSSVLRVKDALATREQSERLLSRRKLRQLSPLKEGGMTSPENTEEAAHNGTYQINVFFEFVVPGVLLNGIGLLGLLGNTLSIAVLSRPQMKSSINCILIGKHIQKVIHSRKSFRALSISLGLHLWWCF